MASNEPMPSAVAEEEPSIIVVGVHPVDVRTVPAEPRRINAFVHQRGAAQRWQSGHLFFAAAIVAVVVPVVALALNPLAWGGLIIPAGLGALGLLRYRQSHDTAELMRAGVLVPARVRVVESGVVMELMFSTNARHPNWDQVFTTSPGRSRTWTVHYTLGDERVSARCTVRGGDRVACVDLDGRLNPAVLVNPERPSAPLLVTERMLQGV